MSGLTRYRIRSFSHANGHLSWHVYDTIDHYDIHTAKTLTESSEAPICCKKICAALNYKEAAKRYWRFQVSKLYLVNFILVQWLFIRICRFIDGAGVQTHWGFLFPVIPLTGWWSSYIPDSRKSIKVCRFASANKQMVGEAPQIKPCNNRECGKWIDSAVCNNCICLSAAEIKKCNDYSKT